jgi:hypothetical protein
VKQLTTKVTKEHEGLGVVFCLCTFASFVASVLPSILRLNFRFGFVEKVGHPSEGFTSRKGTLTARDYNVSRFPVKT